MVDPDQRLTARKALQHPWFASKAANSLAVTRERLLTMRPQLHFEASVTPTTILKGQ